MYEAVSSSELCLAAIELLEQMLAFDPSRRVTAAEALQHRYFRDDGYTPISFSPSSSLSSSSSVADSARSDTPVPMSCSSNDDSGHSSADGQLPEPDNWLNFFLSPTNFFFFFHVTYQNYRIKRDYKTYQFQFCLL